MKKLMTMIAAAAMAFGLYAATGNPDSGFKSGTGFETALVQDGSTEEIFTAGATSVDGSAFWTGAVADTVITAGTYTYGGTKPKQFSYEDSAQYLKIKTTLGTPVTRKVGTGSETLTIDKSLYFDSLVNFTVFDYNDTVTIPSGTKLGVYLMLNEAETETNLYVYANGGQGIKAYKSDSAIAEGWHRLTVKAIENVYKTDAAVGFVVFVDENPVNCTEAKMTPASELTLYAAGLNANGQLFLSLVDSQTQGYKKISSVSFDGQGEVDDLVFTDMVPFDNAKDMETFTATWGTVKENISALTIGTKVLSADEISAGSIELELPDGGSVTMVWTGKDKFIDGSKTVDNVKAEGSVSLTADDVKPAVAMFAGEKFAELPGDDGAIAAANAATADGTLKLLAAAGAIEINNANTVGEDPVVITIDLNGQTVTQGESDAAAITLTAGALKIIDSEGDGVVAGNDQAMEKIAILSDLAVEIAGGTFNGAIGVYGGLTISSLDPEVEVASNESAPEATFVGDADGKAFVKNAVETYWIVGDPVAETYEVTWDDSEANATAVAKVHGIEIESGDEFETGTEVAFTVTPEAGYEYAAEPEDWNLEENGTITATFEVAEEDLEVEIPAATAKTYAVTWDDSAVNAEAVAKVHGLPVESGTKFTSGTEVAFTVTPIPGYEYATAPANWTLEENGTITATFTVAEEDLVVTIPAATAKTFYVQTYTNGVEYVQESYTFGDQSITLTDPIYDTETEEWDGKWYTTADGDTEWTFDGSVAGNTQKAYAKITAKAAPLPTPIQGGSEEQKAAYIEWAAANGVTGNADINAVAFALELNVENPANIEAETQAKLADVLEPEEKAAAEVAKFSDDYTPDYFYIDDYPIAKFKFVETDEIESDNGKLFRLTAEFNSLK
ncbi:MAG: hypothetical protein KBT68_04550 [bacterium]|nr:hypothetical protein [Candidatus Colisoma equi]